MSDKEALQELQCGPVFLFEGGGSAGRLLGFLVTSRRQKSFPLSFLSINSTVDVVGNMDVDYATGYWVFLFVVLHPASYGRHAKEPSR